MSKYEVKVPRTQYDSQTHDKYVTVEPDGYDVVLRVESGNYDFDRRVDAEVRLTPVSASYIQQAIEESVKTVLHDLIYQDSA